MSRIGKKPVVIPSGVKVNLDGNKISVTGPKGSLEKSFSDSIDITLNNNIINVSPREHNKATHQLYGLTRALIDNMVVGVTKGFKKELLLTGVGFKADVKGNSLQLSLGFSHQIDFILPQGIQARIEREKIIKIVLEGYDKELLGLTASKIRDYKQPEPYKGKGIQYIDEIILRKAGKTTGKKK